MLDGHYNDLLNALRHGSVDIVYGVLRRPKWAFDIEERFLFSNRYAVVARRDHPIRMLRRITTSDLARYDWIMPPGNLRCHAFEQIFKERKIQPKVSVETTRWGSIERLLGTSDRLSLFSHREVDADRTAGFEALPYRSPSLNATMASRCAETGSRRESISSSSTPGGVRGDPRLERPYARRTKLHAAGRPS